MYDYSQKEIFATLTYSRSKSVRDTWLSVTSDTNRFIQSISRIKVGGVRAFDEVHYLRAIEHHKDRFPHVHLHLRFRTRFTLRDRDKYMVDIFRQYFKERAHNFGHTDFQCPLVSSGNTVRYIVKYLQKSTGTRRLWSLILQPTSFFPEPPTNELGYPIKQPRYASWKLISYPIFQTLERSEFKWKKIKLLTWSRGYVNTFKE